MLSDMIYYGIINNIAHRQTFRRKILVRHITVWYDKQVPYVGGTSLYLTIKSWRNFLKWRIHKVLFLFILHMVYVVT